MNSGLIKLQLCSMLFLFQDGKAIEWWVRASISSWAGSNEEKSLPVKPYGCSATDWSIAAIYYR